MLTHSHAWQIAVLLVVDLLFFSSTNAATIVPVFLIVGFLLFGLTSYLLIYSLVSFIQLYGLPIRHKSSLAIFLSIVVSLIVALQSIGELSLRDILVIVPLTFVGYMYALFVGTRVRKIDA